MSTAIWNTSDNWAPVEFAAVVEFATDRLSYFYVRMGDAYHHIARKCGEKKDYLITSITADRYNPDMVKKIREAMNSPAVASFYSSKDFSNWLDSLEN